MRTGDCNYFYYHCAIITVFLLLAVVIKNSVTYFQRLFKCDETSCWCQISWACISAPFLGYVVLGKLFISPVPQYTYL